MSYIEQDDRETTTADSTTIALATKIVRRSVVGRRWFFWNSICIAFHKNAGPKVL